MTDATIKAVAATEARCISTIRAGVGEETAAKLVEAIESHVVEPCARCLADKGRVGPPHYGSPHCHAKASIASGGSVAHCTCQGCY